MILFSVMRATLSSLWNRVDPDQMSDRWDLLSSQCRGENLTRESLASLLERSSIERREWRARGNAAAGTSSGTPFSPFGQPLRHSTV